MLGHLERGQTGKKGSLSRVDNGDGRTTHCFCYVHVGWRNFFALLISYFHLPHVPNTESRPIELRPDVTPALVLVRFLPIRVPLKSVHKWTGKVYLLRVSHGERDDGTDFRVKGGFIGR